MKEYYSLWFVSVYIFTATFSLVVSLIMFYLRSKGGTDKYTKSQLWALSILGFLFLMNFAIICTDIAKRLIVNAGGSIYEYPYHSLWSILTIFTAFLLLAFGISYPRPLAKWTLLRPLLITIFILGLLVVWSDILNEHYYWRNVIPGVDVTGFVYVPATFIPVFIWVSEYSRQPSKEGRMMYTIFIWGFIFAIVTFNMSPLFSYMFGIPYSYTVMIPVAWVLIALVFIKIILALRKLRKRWTTPEYIHLFMLGLSISISIAAAYLRAETYPGGQWDENYDIVLVEHFFSQSFGWMLIRPALFTYGLLRYRMMGSQVKAEQAIALLGAVLSSCFVVLFIVNLASAGDNPIVIGGAIFLGIILIVPFLKASQNVVKRLLPMSAGAKGASMRERRNTYLMGLQTGVVKGEMTDKEDEMALEELRKALDVTKREHHLLLRSISEHEPRRTPKNEVQEAYLIFRDGRLLAHYLAGGIASMDKKGTAGKDTDVVAGMFAAVSEYVKEAMRSEDGMGRMDTIGYGGSQLVIESERNVILAVVLRTADDLAVRHAMRDALSLVNGRYGKVLNASWDGDRADLEGLDGVLRAFVERISEL